MSRKFGLPAPVAGALMLYYFDRSAAETSATERLWQPIEQRWGREGTTTACRAKTLAFAPGGDRGVICNIQRRGDEVDFRLSKLAFIVSLVA